MKNRTNPSGLFLLLLGLMFLLPQPASATQAHSDPEGLYVHQFAHVFFIISLAIFIYWLRYRDLVKETGWRYIQYAALFLILWNTDAMIAHLLDEQAKIIEVQRLGTWHIKITSTDNTVFTIVLYYLVKLDHLLCVPALFFFSTGIRKLLQAAQQPSPPRADPMSAGEPSQ
jgi:hypothetical protein